MLRRLEFWLEVPGHPRYSVSSNGRIRGPRKMLTPQPVGDAGYLQVRLHVTGTQYKAEYLHRLVCLAFHGPAPEGKPLALHRDGNYLNNRSYNIYWGNSRTNYDDAVRHGTAQKMVMRGERNGYSKFTDEERMEILDMREQGYKLQRIAHHYGVTKHCIWSICRKYANVRNA